MITALDLETPQIRPLIQGDLPLYLQLHCNELTMRHIGAPLSQTAAELSFLAAMTSNARDWPSRYTWAVRRRTNTSAAGLVALLPADPTHDPCCAELGAVFLPSARGQAFVGRSMLAVMSHAFSKLGVRALTASHLDSHQQAMRVVEKLGFRPVSAAPASIWRWRAERADWLDHRDSRRRTPHTVTCGQQDFGGVR